MSIRRLREDLQSVRRDLLELFHGEDDAFAGRLEREHGFGESHRASGREEPGVVRLLVPVESFRERSCSESSRAAHARSRSNTTDATRRPSPTTRRRSPSAHRPGPRERRRSALSPRPIARARARASPRACRVRPSHPRYPEDVTTGTRERLGSSPSSLPRACCRATPSSVASACRRRCSARFSRSSARSLRRQRGRSVEGPVDLTRTGCHHAGIVSEEGSRGGQGHPDRRPDRACRRVRRGFGHRGDRAGLRPSDVHV